MALTRKFLVALGIEDAKIDEIISAHTETVDALKEARDKYKADAEKLPEVQKNLDKANTKIAEYEDADGKNTWQTKYNTLKTEYDDYKKDIANKEILAKKQSAYKTLLKDVGVSEKRIDSIMKVTDLSKIELDDKDAISGADKLKESVKTEWADFIVKTEERGANVPKPETNNHGSSAKPPMSAAAQRIAAQRASMYGSIKED